VLNCYCRGCYIDGGDSRRSSIEHLVSYGLFSEQIEKGKHFDQEYGCDSKDGDVP